MHIAQSRVLTRRSPLSVHSGSKCARCLRFIDRTTDAVKQLCLSCFKFKFKNFQSNLEYVPSKYVLPQMTEEDPERKPVTWAFYCARSSWGCYAIEQSHFRTLKEAFTNSVRLVAWIFSLLFIKTYINLLILFFRNYGPFGQTNRVGYPLKVKDGGVFVATANAISRISSRFLRPPNSKENWLPMGILSEIIIFKYRPMDIMVLIMSQPACFTISPQHLVSFFSCFYSGKWK